MAGRVRGTAPVPVMVPAVPADAAGMLAWLAQVQQAAGSAVAVSVHRSLRQIMVTVVDEEAYRGWCTVLRCPLGSRRIDELGAAMTVTAQAGTWQVTVTCHLPAGRSAA